MCPSFCFARAKIFFWVDDRDPTRKRSNGTTPCSRAGPNFDLKISFFHLTALYPKIYVHIYVCNRCIRNAMLFFFFRMPYLGGWGCLCGAGRGWGDPKGILFWYQSAKIVSDPFTFRSLSAFLFAFLLFCNDPGLSYIFLLNSPLFLFIYIYLYINTRRASHDFRTSAKSLMLVTIYHFILFYLRFRSTIVSVHKLQLLLSLLNYLCFCFFDLLRFLVINYLLLILLHKADKCFIILSFSPDRYTFVCTCVYVCVFVSFLVFVLNYI